MKFKKHCSVSLPRDPQLWRGPLCVGDYPWVLQYLIGFREMTQERTMKELSLLLCLTVHQFCTYVNFFACTTVIFGWIVTVNSFREELGFFVCFFLVFLKIVSAHQCLCGFFLPGAEDCRLWYHYSFWSDSHLLPSDPQFISTSSTLSHSYQTELMTFGWFWFLSSFPGCTLELFPPCFSLLLIITSSSSLLAYFGSPSTFTISSLFSLWLSGEKIIWQKRVKI